MANIPTHQSPDAALDNYAQGWGAAHERSRRFRMVVGFNSMSQPNEDDAAAQNRVLQLYQNAVANAQQVYGRVVAFSWRPRFARKPAGGNQNFAPQLRAALPNTDAFRALARAEALENVPYGQIRSRLLESAETREMANDLIARGYQPYIHAGDPDTVSFTVPSGKGDPSAAGAKFGDASTETLYNRFVTLWTRRMRARANAKEAPDVMGGGYQIERANAPMTQSRFANRLDMQMRRILLGNSLDPSAAYLPEPGLFVRWGALPGAAGPALQADIFGRGPGESKSLIRTLVSARRAQLGNVPGVAAQARQYVRERLTLKLQASIATGTAGGGNRFRAVEEQQANPVRSAAGTQAWWESVLKAGQSHANPTVWRRQALVSVGADAGNGANQARAHQTLIAALQGKAVDELGALLQASAPAAPMGVVQNLDAAQHLALVTLANESADLYESLYGAVPV